MTRDRIKALEDAGFVWDSHSAIWEERFKELQEFHRLHEHVNVPTKYEENRKLAACKSNQGPCRHCLVSSVLTTAFALIHLAGVKCQRRQYKLLQEGKSSNMTDKRKERLEELGFEWQLRSYYKYSDST